MSTKEKKPARKTTCAIIMKTIIVLDSATAFNQLPGIYNLMYMS